MPRAPRTLAPGDVGHVFNRGVRRLQLFNSGDDYLYFQHLMGRAQERWPMRLLAYCLMPNHWHLVVWPEHRAAVSAYMQRLTWSHSCHVNAKHETSGHSYEGRYKCVPVSDELHLVTALRYVESNPVRAGLVSRAEDWPWSSLRPCHAIQIAESPVRRPTNWLEILNARPEPVTFIL